MKYQKLKSIIDNWRWLLGILMFAVVILTLFYSYATTDVELKNSEMRKQLKINFENEMKELYLPKTAFSEFYGNEKPSSVLVKARIKTNLSEKYFLAYLKRELEKKDWLFYRIEGQNTYKFCRGKYDATLYFKEKGNFSKGDSYELFFTHGLRPLIDFNNFRPESCQ